MNQFLNDNWQQLSKELQAPLEAALRDFLKPLADHAFATLNADDILSWCHVMDNFEGKKIFILC